MKLSSFGVIEEEEEENTQSKYNMRTVMLGKLKNDIPLVGCNPAFPVLDKLAELNVDFLHIQILHHYIILIESNSYFVVYYK